MSLFLKRGSAVHHHRVQAPLWSFIILWENTLYYSHLIIIIIGIIFNHTLFVALTHKDYVAAAAAASAMMESNNNTLPLNAARQVQELPGDSHDKFNVIKLE